MSKTNSKDCYTTYYLRLFILTVYSYLMLYIYLSLPLGWVFIPISVIIGWYDSTDITGMICSPSVVLSGGESLYPGNLVLIHRLIHVKQCSIVSPTVIYESVTANEKQTSDYRCSFISIRWLKREFHQAHVIKSLTITVHWSLCPLFINRFVRNRISLQSGPSS